MSYPDPDHNNHHQQRSQTHQSIPLQDLNRPPDENHNAPAPQSHRRTLSDRGRNLLRQTGGITTGQFRSAQYAPIADLADQASRFVS